VHYLTHLDQIESNIDICIIATMSTIRARVTKELLKKWTVRHIVFEKVLFARRDEYHQILRLLKKKGVEGWINCWRRMIPYYTNISKQCSGSINFTAIGNDFGLGSNGIHLLDFFMMITGGSTIQLSYDHLEKQTFKNKRSEFIEFRGELEGKTPRGDKFRIGCYAGEYKTIQYTIESDTAKYSIIEHMQNYAECTEALKKNNWRLKAKTIQLSYQSDLTQHFVDSLLTSNTCLLPKFENSVPFHLSYIDNFIAFQKSMGAGSNQECMIT
jgi:hypothetical protein